MPTSNGMLSETSDGTSTSSVPYAVEVQQFEQFEQRAIPEAGAREQATGCASLPGGKRAERVLGAGGMMWPSRKQRDPSQHSVGNQQKQRDPSQPGPEDQSECAAATEQRTGETLVPRGEAAQRSGSSVGANAQRTGQSGCSGGVQHRAVPVTVGRCGGRGVTWGRANGSREQPATHGNGRL